MRRPKLFLGIIVLLVVVSGVFALSNRRVHAPASHEEAVSTGRGENAVVLPAEYFSSQAECEKETKEKCKYVACESIPEGIKVIGVCAKGYVPVSVEMPEFTQSPVYDYEVPEGFKGPTGQPHVKGPPGPPPNY